LQAGSEGRRTREKKRKRKKRGGEESGDVWDRREGRRQGVFNVHRSLEHSGLLVD